jgi:hypothetical protein
MRRARETLLLGHPLVELYRKCGVGPSELVTEECDREDPNFPNKGCGSPVRLLRASESVLAKWSEIALRTFWVARETPSLADDPELSV